MSLDIAIVACCYDYGRFAREWAESIVAMNRHPTRCALVDNASQDDSWERLLEAAEILEAAGIECRTKRITERVNLGTARNAAVELSGGTEWVQHLDIDDVALPHMLDDVAEVAPRADVVGLGYRRFGDLKAGPSNRTRTYRDHEGVGTLKSKAPCSGVSPFRRSFWRATPYREDMPGGWDTALWLSFAHQDPPARFRATKRPGFLYRQHAGSVFNSRRKNARRSKLVGWKLEQIRQGCSGVSVLVPWRADGGARDRAFEWVRARYEALHPEYEVVVGTCRREWRKGEAVGTALTQSSGEVLVIADADCVLAPEALEAAVAEVRGGAPWVVPHGLVHRLDEPTTARILESEPGAESFDDVGYARDPYEGFAGGGCIVIERCKYQASGGIPTKFRGWGAEDETLALILDSLIGTHVRLDAPLWHLWHPPGKRQKHSAYRENRSIYRMVQNAAGNPDVLYSLVTGLEAGTARVEDRGVVMVALMDFQVGARPVKKGETFTVTEKEARRYATRKRKVAERLSPSYIDQIREDSKAKTLLIRAEQKRRNEEARRVKDLRERKLARAGNRTKAENTVETGQA